MLLGPSDIYCSHACASGCSAVAAAQSVHHFIDLTFMTASFRQLFRLIMEQDRTPHGRCSPTSNGSASNASRARRSAVPSAELTSAPVRCSLPGGMLVLDVSVAATSLKKSTSASDDCIRCTRGTA